MSKVDAMQAMREARYAARAANKTATSGQPASAAPRRRPTLESEGPVASTAAPADRGGSPAVQTLRAVPEVEAEVSEALCGHRSMNNRLCRRPAGHSEKNHRYS